VDASRFRIDRRRRFIFAPLATTARKLSPLSLASASASSRNSVSPPIPAGFAPTGLTVSALLDRLVLVEDRHTWNGHHFSDHVVRDIKIFGFSSVRVARTSRPSLRVISVTPCRTAETLIAGAGAIVNANGLTYPKVIWSTYNLALRRNSASTSRFQFHGRSAGPQPNERDCDLGHIYSA
jgi:hypothetical protein